MLTPSLQRELKYTATVKSHPKKGTRSGPSISFDVSITAIDSVSPFTDERVVVDTPFKMKQTFAYTDSEISTGMFLEFANVEYSIKGVASYPEADGFVFYSLYLEDLNSK